MTDDNGTLFTVEQAQEMNGWTVHVGSTMEAGQKDIFVGTLEGFLRENTLTKEEFDELYRDECLFVTMEGYSEECLLSVVRKNSETGGVVTRGGTDERQDRDA